MDSHTAHATSASHKTAFATLVVGALGVVFGDIGTSPLYTLKECMTAAGGAKAGVEDLFGILSLMFWSLVGDDSLTKRIESALHMLWDGIGKKSPAAEAKSRSAVKRK